MNFFINELSFYLTNFHNFPPKVLLIDFATFNEIESIDFSFNFYYLKEIIF